VRHTSLPESGHPEDAVSAGREVFLRECQAEPDIWCEARYVQLGLDGQALCASEGFRGWLSGPRLATLGAAARLANGAQRAQARIDNVDVQLVRMNHRTGSYYLAVLTRSEASTRTVRLSEMQQRVAELAAKGGTAQQISVQLGVSANTVKFHLKRVYELLKVSNRVELSRALSAQT
jgi:DNA-binding CsgD family transcriptional regulator